jgi:N-acyl homoserine lactone hydrolase
MTRTSIVRRVVPLTFGWEHLPRSVSVLGADPTVKLREPVPGVLCEVDGGWILLDAGFNTPYLVDPLKAPGYVFEGIRDELVGDHGDTLDVAFAAVEIDPDDVVAVAVSHLHYDHAGGLHRFAGRVPVHCQRQELAAAEVEPGEPEPPGNRMVDYHGLGIDWRLANGDTELAAGLTAVATYGHTAGHQSFVVDLAGGGGFVFAFDAADLQVNIDDELSPGGLAGSGEERAAEAIESIRRLKAIAAERGYRLLPGHDPYVWPAFSAELGHPGPAGPTRAAAL